MLGCSQQEVNYYENPNVIDWKKSTEYVEMGGYQLSKEDEKLMIIANNQQFEVHLPQEKSTIQSTHLSYDEQFLAFDVTDEDGVKAFVIDLKTGVSLNLSDTIGYGYNYDGYENPFGLAWSPNQNLIAFIGGSHDSAKVDIYHLEMENRKQANVGSFIFDNVYGVKWDSAGDSIYYLVKANEDDHMYEVYQTEIEINTNLLAGPVEVVAEMNEDGYEKWLTKKE